MNHAVAIAAVLACVIGGRAVEVAAWPMDRKAEIGSTIYLKPGPDMIIWHDEDANNGTSCIQMVETIERNGVKAVQFIPTFQWMDEGARDPPPEFDSKCQGHNAGDGYYCYNRFDATVLKHWCYEQLDDEGCSEVTPSEMGKFTTQFSQCIKRAVALGLDISVNVRVDDGRTMGGWRNTIDFSPTKQLGSWTYLNSILYPVVDAIKLGAQKDTKVDMVLQGGMGATLFLHPGDWAEARKLVRERLASRKTRSKMQSITNARLGVGLSQQRVSGFIGANITDEAEYQRHLKAEFAKATASVDKSVLHNTIMGFDFIALDGGLTLPSPDSDVCQFEEPMKLMVQELAMYGLKLQEMYDKGMALQFLDVGVGGALTTDGYEIAVSAAEAAKSPSFGREAGYSCAADPFQMCTPDQPSSVRSYRRKYFARLSDYVLQGGCDYAAEAVYLKNLGSWDAQGVQSATFCDDTSEKTNPTAYYDSAIANTITRHNHAVRARRAWYERRWNALAPRASGLPSLRYFESFLKGRPLPGSTPPGQYLDPLPPLPPRSRPNPCDFSHRKFLLPRHAPARE